jgi:hypothetical protein
MAFVRKAATARVIAQEAAVGDFDVLFQLQVVERLTPTPTPGRTACPRSGHCTGLPQLQTIAITIPVLAVRLGARP